MFFKDWRKGVVYKYLDQTGGSKWKVALLAERESEHNGWRSILAQSHPHCVASQAFNFDSAFVLPHYLVYHMFIYRQVGESPLLRCGRGGFAN